MRRTGYSLLDFSLGEREREREGKGEFLVYCNVVVCAIMRQIRVLSFIYLFIYCKFNY